MKLTDLDPAITALEMPVVNAEIATLREELGEVEARMADYLRKLGLDG